MGKGSKKSRKAPRAGRSAPKEAMADEETLQGAMRDLKLDPRGDGMYSGTFRWLESKQFPELPPFDDHEENNNNQREVCFDKGWEGYLRSRSTANVDLVAQASKDPSCLDALSFPITVAHIVTVLGLLKDVPTAHIVILGATRKAEQRVWCITDYWHELAHLFPSQEVTLWFVGPEADRDLPAKKCPPNMHVRHLRGTFGDFTAAATACSPCNTVLVGFNTGFGNFVESAQHGLFFSWLPDLYKIAESGYPMLFTCANDYADMNGEFAVQSRIIGAKMLLLPQQNPFSAASHLHEEGKQDTSWSRGNSFLYVIQGFDRSRRIDLRLGDTATLQQRLEADLDLHLVDALGRHFFKGMVLSREQASRCKALKGPGVPVSPKVSPLPSLVIPDFEIRRGGSPRKMVVRIHVPALELPRDRVAVDVSASVLSLLVPGKYMLRTRLPFEVDSNAPVEARHAPPFLHVSTIRVD